MRNEAQPVVCVVVNSVVALVDGKSHDRERVLTAASYEYQALGAILSIADVPHVVCGINCQPCSIKHEVEVRVVSVARHIDALTINVILTEELSNLNRECIDKVIEDDVRQLDSVRC